MWLNFRDGGGAGVLSTFHVLYCTVLSVNTTSDLCELPGLRMGLTVISFSLIAGNINSGLRGL